MQKHLDSSQSKQSLSIKDASANATSMNTKDGNNNQKNNVLQSFIDSAPIIKNNGNLIYDLSNVPSDLKITVQGAREHNLKNVNLQLPRNRMIVFTGLSGSGKSSLAFDTLFAERSKALCGILKRVCKAIPWKNG